MYIYIYTYVYIYINIVHVHIHNYLQVSPMISIEVSFMYDSQRVKCHQPQVLPRAMSLFGRRAKALALTEVRSLGGNYVSMINIYIYINTYVYMYECIYLYIIFLNIYIIYPWVNMQKRWNVIIFHGKTHHKDLYIAIFIGRGYR